MAKWTEIRPAREEQPDFDEYEFIDIAELIDKEFDVIQVIEYSNDQGPGVVAVIDFDGKTRKMVTHSIGVVKTLTDPRFKDVLQKEPVTVTLRQAKSKKTGKFFYYLE